MSTVATPIFPATSGDRQTSAVADLRRRVAALERGNGGVRLGAINGGLLIPQTMPGGALDPATMPGVLEGGWFKFDTTLVGVRVPGDLVVDGTLTAGKLNTPLAVVQFLQAGVLNADLFTADVAVANKLLVNGVAMADQVVANGLMAISANMGTLTAGKALFVGTSGAQVGLGRGLQYTPPGGPLTQFDGMLMADPAGAVTLIANAETGDLQWKAACLPGSSGLGNISGSIHGETQVQQGTIPGDRMVLDAIGVRELNAFEVTAIELDAANARIGQLKANAVDAMTVTGATVQSTPPGSGVSRACLDPTGVFGYDSGDVERFSFKTGTGRATLVDATIKSAAGYPRLEISGGKLRLWTSSGNDGVVIDGTQTEPRILFENLDLSADLGNARKGYLYGDSVAGAFQMEVRSDNGLQVLKFDASDGARVQGSSWSVISDVRVKHLISPISDALAKLQVLRGATFFHDSGGPRRAGVVAQDVARVLPEAIDTMTMPLTGVTLETVDVAAVIGLLVSAVQEDVGERVSLEERVDVLEAALTALPGGLRRK